MLNSKIYLIILLLVRCSNCFLVGDCIGPKEALERHLDGSERSVLRSIVHENFNGKNAAEVMRLVLTFVRSRLSQSEWSQIQPEIRAHEARQSQCSIYAQLLPSALYRRLLQRVWEASERGADQAEIRQIVEQFVADLTRRGQLATVPPVTPPHEEQAEDPNQPASRPRRTFPTLLQYPVPPYPQEEEVDTRPWYAGGGPAAAPISSTVEWPDRRVVARRIGDGRSSSFVPLPAAQPVRWVHSGHQHVPARRPATVSVFPTLIPPLGTAIDRTEDTGEEDEEEDTEASPVFERVNFGHDSSQGAEIPPVRQLPIPVAKMPRIRLSDGRYMRPPLTLKVARALATRMPRTSGTTSHRPSPPLQAAPSPSPSTVATSRHSRRRRPLAPSPQLTFPRVLPRFGTVSEPPQRGRHSHPPLIELL